MWRWVVVLLGALAGASEGVEAPDRLLYALAAPSPTRNAAFSPAAVRLALQVARAGARGRTREQLDALLAREGGPEVQATPGADADLDRDGVALQLSAALFADKRALLRDDFADQQRAKGLLVRQMDIEHRYALSRGEMERWLENRTLGTAGLPEGAVGLHTRLVLLSAVSLRGRWLNPFVDFVTKPLPFRNADLTESVVPTMQQIAYTPFAQLPELQARAVLLPFENERLFLMLLLPDDEGGVPALEERLRRVDCASLVSRFAARMVQLRVPRFRVDAGLELSGALRAAGVTDLFSADAADLSGALDAGRGVALGALGHAACLEVREGGAQVEAPTVVTDAAPAPAAGAAPPRERFFLDRPFVFYVLPHPATSILLQGRVVHM